MAIMASEAVAQSKLTLVMDYRWNMGTEKNNLISERACQDGIEFDFDTERAHYYVPDAEIWDIVCKITKTDEPIVNTDGSTTYGFQLYEMGREAYVQCVLNVPVDLKKIQFTMIDNAQKTAIVYRVISMMTDD